MDANGDYQTDSQCDGSDATILAESTCEVTMSTFTGSSFNLVLGDLIQVQIRAINEKGAGQFSAPLTEGVYAEVKPQAPTSAPTRGDDSNEAQLDIDWTFLTTYEQKGGSTIDSYEL